MGLGAYTGLRGYVRPCCLGLDAEVPCVLG